MGSFFPTIGLSIPRGDLPLSENTYGFTCYCFLTPSANFAKEVGWIRDWLCLPQRIGRGEEYSTLSTCINWLRWSLSLRIKSSCSSGRGVRNFEIKALVWEKSPPARAGTMLTACKREDLCSPAILTLVFMCWKSLRRTPETRFAIIDGSDRRPIPELAGFSPHISDVVFCRSSPESYLRKKT